MYQKNIKEEKGTGIYSVSIAEDVEKLNPIEYFKSSWVQLFTHELKGLLLLKNPTLASAVSDEFLIKKANEGYEEILKEQSEIILGEPLIALLEARKKSVQVKLLKNVTLL